MVFDATVRMGDVVTVLFFLIGGLGALYTLRNESRNNGMRLDAFDLRFNGVEIEMKKQTDILVALARQDERMRSMDERIKKLEKLEEED